MKIIFFLLCILGISSDTFAQTYTYDNNHQITEIRYDNGVVITIQYDANGNKISSTTSGGALPVTLLNFIAQKSGEHVLLTWATSQEINSDKFEVEYSKDGNDFDSFAIVRAKGNTSSRSEYTTTHCCPIEGVNFYRLKMFDKNGRFKYSEIRKVTFEFVTGIKLHPNPVTGQEQLTISFKTAFSREATISVYSANGVMVLSRLLPRGEKTIQLNTEPLIAGSYYIIATDGDKKYKKEFVKQ